MLPSTHRYLVCRLSSSVHVVTRAAFHTRALAELAKDPRSRVLHGCVHGCTGVLRCMFEHQCTCVHGVHIREGFPRGVQGRLLPNRVMCREHVCGGNTDRQEARRGAQA